MRKLALSILALGFVALSADPASAQMQMAETEEVELTAQVVDLSCKMVYDLSGEDHRQCTQVCADNGVPLGLLTADGQFYLPVSDQMPGANANDVLRPHAERQVTVKGKVIKRAGLPSIIIESVEAQ